MVNDMKKKERLKYIRIVLLFLIFLAVFFPWVCMGNESFTILEFYRKITANDVLTETVQNGAILQLLPYFLIFPLTASCLSGIKAVLLILGIRSSLLGKVIYGAELVYIATYFAFQGYMPCPTALVAVLLVFAEFMISRYASDYETFTKEWERTKVKEQQEKSEKKKRLFFQGKYDKEIWKVVKRAMTHRKKSVFLICIGNSIFFATLCVLFTMREHLQHEYSTVDAIPTTGISGIVHSATTVTIILYLFFEVLAFYHYARNRRTLEQTFWRLGARSGFKSQVRFLEYCILIVLSFGIGHILGMGIYLLAWESFQKHSTVMLPLQGSFPAYLESAGVYFVVACITAFLTNDKWGRIRETESVRFRYNFYRNSKFQKILFFTGALITGLSFYCFSMPRNGENIYTILFGIGGGVLLLNVAGNKRKGKCLINRTSSLLFLLHLVFFAVLSMDLAGNLTAPEAAALFPYDYVCMAYEEDEELFQKIEEEDIGEVKSYPMTRVTTVQGAPVSWIDVANNYYMKVIWPQGQHVGISENTYKELRENLGLPEEKLQLKGDEIYIVFQQDLSVKAHPLDWYMSRRKPYVRIGQPLQYYQFVSRERLYPPRKVAGTEREVLTGVFQGGREENLVVFSNDYFEKLSVTEGPCRLYLLDVRKGKEKEAKKRLESFQKVHAEDSSWSRSIQPCYGKTEKVRDIETERMLKKTSLLFEIALLIMCVFLIEAMKMQLERKERGQKYRLLLSLGAYRSVLKSFLKRELGEVFIKPLIYVMLLSVPLTVITCYLRKMTYSEIIAFAGACLLLWGIYFVIHAAVYGIIYRNEEEHCL